MNFKSCLRGRYGGIIFILVSIVFTLWSWKESSAYSSRSVPSNSKISIPSGSVDQQPQVKSSSTEQPFARNNDDNLRSPGLMTDAADDNNHSPGSSMAVCEVSFTSFMESLMITTWGPTLQEAIYDPEMFNHVASQLAAGEDPGKDSFVWKMGMLRQPPRVPDSFDSTAGVLWFTKRLLSIGVARLHRDAALSLLHQHVCGSVLSYRVFEQAVRRALEAYAQYFHTMLQFAIDVSSSGPKERLEALRAAGTLGADPLVLLMTHVGAATTVGQISSMLDDVDKHVHAVTPAAAARNAAARVASLFPLYYQDPVFDLHDPSNGKFWNMIRPTATCSSLVRLCELADGCRLLCNAEYLLFAGHPQEGRSLASDVFPHRMLGFGCNNDYDWEKSLIRLFQGANATRRGASNELGWMTVFDCTLTMTPGPRKFRPPAEFERIPIGFGFAPLCFDGVRSEQALSPKDVKKYILAAEKEHASNQPPKLATRLTVGPRATARAGQPDAHLQKTTSNRKPDVPFFDAVSIFKADVEGFEFNTMPSWSREELKCIAAHDPQAVAKHSRSLIDFEQAARDFFTVSLFSMEFHRAGHKTLAGAKYQGALRAHYLMLHIYSLGFIMVGHEKNQYDQCCYEQGWAHVRHYIRSETWMIARGEF